MTSWPARARPTAAFRTACRCERHARSSSPRTEAKAFAASVGQMVRPGRPAQSSAMTVSRVGAGVDVMGVVSDNPPRASRPRGAGSSCVPCANDYTVGKMNSADNLGAPLPLRIGPHELDGAVMLAPMSGISDLAMRRIARRFGAALVFSEMVAAESYLDGDDETVIRAEGEGLAPHALQLVGRDPKALAGAARKAEGAGAEIIDINMGCPARRVSGQLCGAALMRDLDLA